MFIDGSSYVRKVEADCVSERESRDVSPCIRLTEIYFLFE